MRWLVSMACGLALVALLVASTVGPEGRRSLLAGLMDPVLGPDHFLTLLTVGVWAGQMGCAARWALPAAFLIGMFLGFGIVAGQPLLPAIDSLVRVLAVALLFLVTFAIIIRLRLPLRYAVSSIALLGGCHGHLNSAHSSDFGPHLAATTAWWFSAGTLASATVLLGLGVTVGLTLVRPR